MRGGVLGPRPRQGAPVAIVPAKAPRALPHREGAVHGAAHGDPQPGTGPPARLLGDLQDNIVQGDHVVLADRALGLLTEDRVEINPVKANEGAGGAPPPPTAPAPPPPPPPPA